MEGGPSDTDEDHRPHPSPLPGVQPSPPAPLALTPRKQTLCLIYTAHPLPPPGQSSPFLAASRGAAEACSVGFTLPGHM